MNRLATAVIHELEHKPAGEDEAIAEIVASQRRAIRTGSRNPAQRAQHPKSHGCVKAQFKVRDGLPNWARHGVFEEPAVFEALVRFSNGRQRDDRQGDMHGMAIKLLNRVDDDTPIEQDFILADHPVFMVRDAVNYIPFLKYVPGIDAKLSEKLRFVFMFGLVHRSLRGIKIGSALNANRIRCLLERSYHSQTPYLLGDLAVKYQAQPEHNLDELDPGDPQSEHYLKAGLANYLKKNAAHFSFGVQRQSSDLDGTPIEDATVEWNTQVQMIADLHIPGTQPACEDLVFMPWNCLPEHRPLGGINRARNPAYRASAAERHSLNGVPEDG